MTNKMDCSFCGAKNEKNTCTLVLPVPGEFWLGCGKVGVSCPDCHEKARYAIEQEYRRKGEAMSSYIYIQTEPKLWTVGFYDEDGDFQPESDYSSPREAAHRVHYLNGGDYLTQPE